MVDKTLEMISILSLSLRRWNAIGHLIDNPLVRVDVLFCHRLILLSQHAIWAGTLYGLDTNISSISPWICQYPVHHVVGKYKTIQCFVTCATTIFAQKNVTRTLIKFSGKSIKWLSLKGITSGPFLPL